MRTIFVRVTNEASPSYTPALAAPITSTTFSIDRVHWLHRRHPHSVPDEFRDRLDVPGVC